MFSYTTQLKICALAPVLIPLLIFLYIVLIVPIFAIRWSVNHLSQIFRRDLHKILNPNSSLYLAQGERANCIAVSTFQGLINVGDVRTRVTTVLTGPSASHPEFKMYPTTWLGYSFWRKEQAFDPDEHFNYYGPIPADTIEEEEEFIERLQNEMVKIKFHPEKSPWDVTLAHGRATNTSYIFWKFHHSMADAYSILKALLECMDQQGVNSYSFTAALEMARARARAEKSGQLWKLSLKLISAGYEVTQAILDGIPSSPWEMNVADMSKGTRVIVKIKEAIDCGKIKEIRANNGVTFTAVVLLGITGGMRNTLRKQKPGVPLPLSVPIVNLIPLPGHSGELSNHFTSTLLHLPTGETDKLHRLQKCERELQRMKNSSMPFISALITKATGSLPQFILSRIHVPKHVPPIQISNFAGPNDPLSITGHPMLDLYDTVRVGPTIPVLLSLISYNGKIRITANADPGIFPDEKSLQEFMGEIQSEIHSLCEA